MIGDHDQDEDEHRKFAWKRKQHSLRATVQENDRPTRPFVEREGVTLPSAAAAAPSASESPK